MSNDLVFRALADASRRHLLDHLHRKDGQTLGQLSAGLGMTRQAVSKHLLILEDAALVIVMWDGREKLHYINRVPINTIASRWMGKFDRSRIAALDELKKKLEEDQ